MAVPELTEGSLLQLHVRDANWLQKGVSTCLQVCSPCMPAQSCRPALDSTTGEGLHGSHTAHMLSAWAGHDLSLSALIFLFEDTGTCLTLLACITNPSRGSPVSSLRARHRPCTLSWSDRALLRCRSMRITCLGRWPRTLRSWAHGCIPAAVPHMTRPLPLAGPCLIWRSRCSISTAAATAQPGLCCADVACRP